MKNKITILAIFIGCFFIVESCSQSISSPGTKYQRKTKNNRFFRLPNVFDNRTFW